MVVKVVCVKVEGSVVVKVVCGGEGSEGTIPSYVVVKVVCGGEGSVVVKVVWW